MPGLGTIVNVIAVLAGGVLGLFLGGTLKKRFQDILIQALGICTLFIGVSGTLEGLLVITDGKIETKGAMVLIASLVPGAFVGECFQIEKHIEALGEWLKIKARSSGDTTFSEGFLTATLTICVGAMAIVGSIQDGLLRNPTMLFTKSILDFVIILILASTFGKGVIFSAIPLALFQGFITLLAGVIQPFMTNSATHNLSFVGSSLLFCVGINLAFGKKFKVANMLPALIFSILIAYI